MSHSNGERYDDVAEDGAAQFNALHALALQVADRLTTQFDVAREERLGPDPRMGAVEVVRPTIQLVPRSEESAPLVFTFTAEPGLHVAFGRWYTRAFPAWGSASFEEERDRFLWRVLQLVEGRYREATGPGHPGFLVQQHEFWAPDGMRAGGECKISAPEDEALGVEVVIEWQPWLRRLTTSSA